MSSGYQQQDEEVHLGEPDLSGSYSARDYLNWKFEGFAEMIRGKIFKLASPFPLHQGISRRILRRFYACFPENHKCKVFDAPTDVFLIKPGENYQDTQNVVQPDIFVICDPSKITNRAIIGSPDLVVEILSSNNSKRDLKDKMELYEEYQIPEYWIVDPQNKSVTLYLFDDGVYQPQKPRVEGDKLQSKLFPNLEIDVEEIFLD